MEVGDGGKKSPLRVLKEAKSPHIRDILGRNDDPRAHFFGQLCGGIDIIDSHIESPMRGAPPACGGMAMMPPASSPPTFTTV